MAKTLTTKQKAELRNKIRQEIKAGTFIKRTFCARNKVSDRTIERLIERNSSLKKTYEEYRKCMDTAKKCPDKSKSKAKAYQGEEVIKDFKETTGVVTTRSLDIKTVEELLKISEVDMDVWEVERSVINSWEVTVGGIKTGTGQCETFTNYQVKVWLKRVSPAVDALNTLYEKIKAASPIVPVIKRCKLKDADGNSINRSRELEISLFDLHLGLRCYKPAADINWTPDEAEIMTVEILDELIRLTKVHGPFERIVFAIGNDFLHTDTPFGTTTAGTPQPEGDAWKNTFLRGELLGLALVDKMLQVAPVKVISVPGNHAHSSEVALGRILNAYYHSNENFTMDASMSPFKFHNFGVNLIGFEHGHSIKQQVRLAALMANENRLNGVWENARYCEFHCGDQHRKGSGKPHMFEEQGVSIEFLPGLTPPNEWHRIHSYNWQKRAGLAFIWDKTAGPIARFQVNIDNYSGKIMG